MKVALFVFVIVSIARPQSTPPEHLVVPSLFSDNMVLQQKSNVPVWGKAKPGEKVTVQASWGQTAWTTVKPDGNWDVHLKTIKAGGPYELSITAGDSTAVYRKVLLGEVWLCSGQSNMEMPLQGWPPENPILNAAEEVQKAYYPHIRLFTVAKALAATPEFNCAGAWSECTPQTAAEFSAVAYFFGRKLHKELHVPIGLIVSSWGGTKIQPWISGRYLADLPKYTSVVGKMDSIKEQSEALNNWIHLHPVIKMEAGDSLHRWENLNFDDSACAERNFDDSRWGLMNLPNGWETASVGEFDGAVWFRKTINIPNNWIDSTLMLKLCPIDDMDETWVNGVKVGGLLGEGFWNIPRMYEVPKEAVTDSSLTIAVRVIDNGGGGGLWGNGVKLQIHLKSDTAQFIPLSGDWKYLPVAEYVNDKFYVYGVKGNSFVSRPQLPFSVGQNTPTMIFNGMISPLIPYFIKGALWYQGESNAYGSDEYNGYNQLLQLLIKNWRTDWSEGNFPFYLVQLAPWSYWQGEKSHMIRDAQRQALSVPNTGVAVTLDIGSLTTVHPPNKQDVGLRLALWALARDYGKRIVYSGPIYKSMSVRNDKAIISFNNAEGGLVVKQLNRRTNFIIAGRDSVFVKAEVKVIGKTLVVYSPEIKHPIAVRYTWDNDEEATLFNKAGLPASTFRTDNWNQ